MVATDMGVDIGLLCPCFEWSIPARFAYLITGRTRGNRLNLPTGSRLLTHRGTKRGIQHYRQSPTREEHAMGDHDKTWNGSDDFWHSGKTTRRKVIGYGVSAGALG